MARRCPEDFVVTDDMRTWGRTEFPKVDLDRETAAMRDWEFAKAHSDWPATWRNWIRKAATMNGHRAPTPAPRKTRYDQAKEALERATAED